MPKNLGLKIQNPFQAQSLGDVTSNQVGWKHGALIQRLESQRKAQLLDLDLHRLLAQDE